MWFTGLEDDGGGEVAQLEPLEFHASHGCHDVPYVCLGLQAFALCIFQPWERRKIVAQFAKLTLSDWHGGFDSDPWALSALTNC